MTSEERQKKDREEPRKESEKWKHTLSDLPFFVKWGTAILILKELQP